MSIASIRRALRPFACDRHGDTAETDGSGPAPIDARAAISRGGRRSARWRRGAAAASRR